MLISAKRVGLRSFSLTIRAIHYLWFFMTTKILALAAAVTAAVTLSGCSTLPDGERTYNDKISRAYNISSNFDYEEVSDSTVPNGYEGDGAFLLEGASFAASLHSASNINGFCWGFPVGVPSVLGYSVVPLQRLVSKPNLKITLAMSVISMLLKPRMKLRYVRKWLNKSVRYSLRVRKIYCPMQNWLTEVILFEKNLCYYMIPMVLFTMCLIQKFEGSRCQGRQFLRLHSDGTTCEKTWSHSSYVRKCRPSSLQTCTP